MNNSLILILGMCLLGAAVQAQGTPSFYSLSDTTLQGVPFPC